MDNNNVNYTAEILSNSLDNTIKIATDTNETVQQVLEMSDQKNNDKLIDCIITDKKTKLEEKISLVERVEENYDKRLENNTQRIKELKNNQTQNAISANSWWSENWGIVLFGVAFCGSIIFGCTPYGKKAISSAINSFSIA